MRFGLGCKLAPTIKPHEQAVSGNLPRLSKNSDLLFRSRAEVQATPTASKDRQLTMEEMRDTLLREREGRHRQTHLVCTVCLGYGIAF